MRAGPYQVTLLEMGRIRLDGGSMFGKVPRALWARHFPPDDENRIELVCRGLLLVGDDRVVVVDTGAGSRWSDRERARYGITGRDVCDALADHGVMPRDVTDCILTHLHFDHAGGAVTPEGKATFPHARYVVQERALAWARAPHAFDRASFREGDFEPLVASGQLETVDGEVVLLPGVRVHLSEGHTTALQLPIVGNEILFPADLVPTRAHLSPTWTMSYDIRPLRCVEEKRRVLDEAASAGWTVIFEHDPQCASAQITKQKNGYAPVSHD